MVYIFQETLLERSIIPFLEKKPRMLIRKADQQIMHDFIFACVN
jgi:hypothetical protein